LQLKTKDHLKKYFYHATKESDVLGNFIREFLYVVHYADYIDFCKINVVMS